jgi:DNA-binding NarL/FixJ family response regulator
VKISRALARVYSDCLERLHSAVSEVEVALAWVQARRALLGEHSHGPTPAVNGRHHLAEAKWLYELFVEQLRRKQSGLADRHTSAKPEERLLQVLTRREREVLHHVALGQTNTVIAHALKISPKTANKHVENILQKLRVETRTAAASIWLSRHRD